MPTLRDTLKTGRSPSFGTSTASREGWSHPTCVETARSSETWWISCQQAKPKTSFSRPATAATTVPKSSKSLKSASSFIFRKHVETVARLCQDTHYFQFALCRYLYKCCCSNRMNCWGMVILLIDLAVSE